MTADIKLLLDKARESITAAELLHEKHYFSFAASRAYYAMFYAAEALLASLSLSYSSHGAVIGGFGREFAKTGILDKKFHRWLIDAQDMRNMGDYGVGYSIAMEQSAEVIAWGHEFLDAAIAYFDKQHAAQMGNET